ncbi:hypothetical protein HY358_00825 [Candidatus Roizmanbacteria bacterium]|nr:hypothetical protein [Candidatus Roizmanbacteria bacterium]
MSQSKWWSLYLIAGLVILSLQSYIAFPRSPLLLLQDLIIPSVIVITSIFVLFKPKALNLLFIGLLYMFLTMIFLFVDSKMKPYGTATFLFGTWLLVDYVNLKKFNQSIVTNMVNPQSKIGKGVFFSTFIFGLITEYTNLPFEIWTYNIPLPSLTNFGIPALIAAFGWTPWTLSILSIFYYFILNEQKMTQSNTK